MPEAEEALERILQQHKKERDALLRSVEEKKALLEQNPLSGRKIQKKKIPKEYIKKYSIDNLWKINLANHWRMLYTLETDEVRILAIVLDIVDHQKYDKKFKYRKK